MIRIVLLLAVLNLATTLTVIALVVQVGKRIQRVPTSAPRLRPATVPAIAPHEPRYRIEAFAADGAPQDAVYAGDDGRLAAQAWRSLAQGTRRGLFRFYDRARLRGTITRTGES